MIQIFVNLQSAKFKKPLAPSKNPSPFLSKDVGIFTYRNTTKKLQKDLKALRNKDFTIQPIHYQNHAENPRICI